MKATGERFVPGKMFKHSEIEHMHRYTIVKNILKDKIVLDAACGTGYGSDIIASVAKQVYGVDISQEAVDFANEHFGARPNLQYLQGDVTKLPFDDETLDAVVSFETIEHINGDMQSQFLKEIRRVLKSDGILIISTPNKEVYTIQTGNKATEWHVKEFYEEEYDDFLKKEFTDIKYFQQYISKASYLLDGSADNVALSNCNSGKKGKFIVAIASNGKIDDKINLNSIYYYPDEYDALDEICQIFHCDATGEFNENQSEIVEIPSAVGEVKCVLDLEGQLVKKVRIDPVNNSCMIENLKIKITDSGNETIYPISVINNADKIVNDAHIFYHRDPQYILEFEKEIAITSLEISFIIKEYNIDAYAFLAERDAFLTERDAFLTERVTFLAERDAFLTERVTFLEKEKEDFMNRPLIHRIAGAVLMRPKTKTQD